MMDGSTLDMTQLLHFPVFIIFVHAPTSKLDRVGPIHSEI